LPPVKAAGQDGIVNRRGGFSLHLGLPRRKEEKRTGKKERKSTETKGEERKY